MCNTNPNQMVLIQFFVSTKYELSVIKTDTLIYFYVSNTLIHNQ